MSFNAGTVIGLPLPHSVETIRSRLQQLTTSLQALQHRILSGNPLPPWSHIQSSLSVILSQLGGLVETLQRSEDELSRLLTVPGNTFPIVQSEGLLTTLYRSKPLPETEAWLQQRADANSSSLEAASVPPIVFDSIEDDGMEDEGEEFSAAEWFQARRNKRQWTGFYTRQETDEDFEIDRDDLDDLRKFRQEESEQSLQTMKQMLRYSRAGV